MYLKEIKNKDTYDTLKLGSCMNCGLLPIYTSGDSEEGVVVSIDFKDNPDWTIKVDVENQVMEHCYCPICTRKMKLLKLKERL